MKHQFFQYSQQSLVALCLMTLSVCSAAKSNQIETPMAVYPSQILYFHYFQLDVPKDINLDASIIEPTFQVIVSMLIQSPHKKPLINWSMSGLISLKIINFLKLP